MAITATSAIFVDNFAENVDNFGFLWITSPPGGGGGARGVPVRRVAVSNSRQNHPDNPH